jgi:hypothetical protein
LAVGTAYLVAQLLLFSPDRAPSWDEAIYLSQVTTPGVHAIAFAPSRARGISLLVAPITVAGGSLPKVRVFLAGLIVGRPRRELPPERLGSARRLPRRFDVG